MQQKCSKIVLVFHIIAFELVAVSSPYYYENNDNFAISFFIQNRTVKKSPREIWPSLHLRIQIHTKINLASSDILKVDSR